MKKLAGLLALAALLAYDPGAASAAEGEEAVSEPGPARGPFWVTGAYGVVGKPEAIGGELAIAAQFRPLASYGLLLVGPKIGGLYARGTGGGNRFDLSWGLQETTWFANAIGTGIDLEAVAPSSFAGASVGLHYRITPNAAIRVSRFGKEGAWAIRVGLPYDTHYKWGIQAGVTLQLNGIPRIGESATE